jgi:hypothetical protein
LSHDKAFTPALGKFVEFRVPSGSLWNLAATPLSPGGDQTNDQGCVAVAHHPDGWVALADTKIDLADQKPLVFLPREWQQFTEAIRDGRL